MHRAVVGAALPCFVRVEQSQLVVSLSHDDELPAFFSPRILIFARQPNRWRPGDDRDPRPHHGAETNFDAYKRFRSDYGDGLSSTGEK